MAARFWRWILGIALALAAVSAMALARAFSLSPWGAAAVATAVLLAMPAALVLVSFLIARGARVPLQVLPGEAAAFTMAILAMCRAAQRRAPDRDVPQHMQPALLLHGLLCNHAVWGPVQARLQAAGFGPIDAPDMEPLFADIETLAAGIAPRLRALQARSNGERVVIVAHSMGGLVARVLLRDAGAGVIRRIVTVASPHHGTALACGQPWTNLRQMCSTSPWLRMLNATQEDRFAVPFASIFSADDNLLAPAASARLAGAEVTELHGVGHFGLLRSRRALERIVATLSPQGPS